MSVSAMGMCDAHYCAPQGNPIEYRPRTSWVTQVDDWKRVSKEVFLQLRSVMDVELTVRGFADDNNLPVWTSLKVGDKTSTRLFAELQEAINKCLLYDKKETVDWAKEYEIGDKVTNRVLELMRSTANNLQQTCICHSDFCPCNCNYCQANFNLDITCIAFGATSEIESGR